MLILPRNIQALACCAGACLQSSFCTWGNFNRRKWGFFNRRKLGNIQPALTQTAEITYLIVTLLLALALMIKWKRQGAIAARLNRGLLGYVVARSTVQLSEPEDTRGEDLISA